MHFHYNRFYDKEIIKVYKKIIGKYALIEIMVNYNGTKKDISSR